MRPSLSKFRGLILLPAVLLAGCNTVLLNPSGDIANQQGRLIVISTALMLLIIVPVILLTLVFAWRYRQSNKDAPYSPEWDHSTALELIIWAAPLLIIIALGAVTWISTHTLDPYRRLSRLDENRPLPVDAKPLVVEVVALDWKWLFIYPEQGIATVNELAAPVDKPITFKITSSSVMNAFYVPALAGMIYAMPGMETRLHAVINKPGDYEGFSANYSGEGFSKMRFRFHGLSNEGFEQWVAKAKTDQTTLDRAGYLALEKHSINDPVRRYGSVQDEMFDLILNRCVDQTKMCAHQMMAIDARGGLGGAGIARVVSKPWRDDDPSSPKQRYLEALVCTVDNPDGRPLARLENSPATPTLQ